MLKRSDMKMNCRPSACGAAWTSSRWSFGLVIHAVLARNRLHVRRGSDARRPRGTSRTVRTDLYPLVRRVPDIVIGARWRHLPPTAAVVGHRGR